MKLAKTISWICLSAMTGGLINGFVNGDFMKDGKALLENPWGIMSMIDLYVGFILFSMWIIFREKNKLVGVLWTVLMMTLGFFTGSLYILIALYKSKGDWKQFFLGHKA